MKKILLSIVYYIIPIIAFSQVSTSPIIPNPYNELTIYFDATGSELENYMGDVYAHTGVTINDNHWLNVLGLWGDNLSQPKLTRDLNNPNLYSLLLSPSVYSFFNVAITETISGIDLVFRSAEGDLQTRPDIFLQIPEYVSIPDVNFEQSLIDLGIDSDGVVNSLILRSDAEAVNELVLNNPLFDTSGFGNPLITTVTDKITDLTGIEAFVNLNKLNLGYGSLTTVDLSNNKLLNDLFLNDNLLTSIDISHNPLLKRFGVMRNPNIGILDVSKNILLEELFLEAIGISNIDLSKNLNLWRLQIQNNNLRGLDLSLHMKLTDVRVRYNASLSYLNVRNGNNSNMTGFDVRDTPSLWCVTADGTAVPDVSQLMFDFSGGLLSTDCGTVYIPDPNFEQALIDLGFDSDGVVNSLILKSEAEAVIDLDLNNKSISSLAGIEHFLGLRYLYCYNNLLTDLNLGNNPNLINLDCGGNALTSIDVSNYSNLVSLSIWGNQLTSLDVSQNPNLEELHCSSNKLKTMDISSNAKLRFMNFADNQLVNLNIANGNNANFLPLDWADFSFDARYNAALKCIQVDANIINNIPSHWFKDEAVSYNENCPLINCEELVAIPDTNFEQALIDLGLDTNGLTGNIKKCDAASVTALDVGNKGISNLQGIESFINLVHLYCYNNQLTTLNLGYNPNLLTLHCGGNALTSIDLSNYPNLVSLHIWINQLTTLDVSSNANLEELFCSTNKLKTMDISSNSKLRFMNFADNQLVNLNIANGNNANFLPLEWADYSFEARYNPALTCIQVDANIINNIPSHWFKDEAVSYNENCPTINCEELVAIPDANFEQALVDLGIDTNGMTGNILKCDAAAAIDLNLNNKNISSLAGIEYFVNLRYLYCHNNLLTELNLGYNPYLINLHCGGNALTSIDVSNYPNLVSLHIWVNKLTILDVSNNHNLEDLICSTNKLTAMDISRNSKLKFMNFADNQLVYLNIANGNNVNFQPLEWADFSFDARYNPDLNCIQVDSAILSNIPTDWFKEETATYNNACSQIFIPDANFEQSLIDLGIDSDGVVNSLILRSDAEAVIDLTVNNKSISSLQGIEHFVNLTYLYCHNNLLTELNLGNNPNLINLHCGDNSLTSIDLSNYPNLVSLHIWGNNLTTLNVSNNSNLEELLCSSNLLKVIDISGNSKLKFMNFADNQLIYLNIANGNNVNFGHPEWADYSFDARSNPDLNCIQVDAAILSNIPTDWFKEGTASYNDACSQIFIPDPNFEQALIDLGFDSDGVVNSLILKSDAASIIDLDLNSKNISSLSGIEHFINLTYLYCNNNLLTEVNLGAKPNLINLDFGGNALTSIELSNYPNLVSLSIWGNQLTSLDVSQNLNLEDLHCSSNKLTSMNISSNSKLKVLNIANNKLVNLNIANGNNANFIKVDWADFSFDARNNPALMCIQVDAGIINNISSYWFKDEAASYNENCPTINCEELVAIPDANFEQVLIAAGFDTNGLTGNIKKCDAASIIDLDLNNKNISSLSGIEHFVGLRYLYCYNNLLTEVNLGYKPNLINLDLGSNSLTTIDLSNCPNLASLSIWGNQLTSLDISQNLNLEDLHCSSNKLTSMNISSNSKLKVLNIANNKLVNLNIANGNNANFIKVDWADFSFDARNNPALMCIQVDANIINNIPADWFKDESASYNENCPIINCDELVAIPDANFEQALIDLGIDTNGMTGNILKCDATAAIDLNLNDKNISSLSGIEHFVGLRYLYCNNNLLTEINLGEKPNLINLDFGRNALTSIDVSNYPKLINLDVWNNQLLSLDVSQNLQLEALIIFTNKLTSLDISVNSKLKFMNFANNKLVNLNIANGNNINFQGPEWADYSFDARNNPALKCIQVDAGIINNIPSDWFKDEAASYNENCPIINCDELVAIPDTNFEQALVALGIDTNGFTGDILKCDAAAAIDLDINNKNISSLAGIEHFVNLRYLLCNNNKINELDLSSNSNLMGVLANQNFLTAINVSNCPNLETLHLWSNQLTSLNVENNVALKDLILLGNNLTNLDVSNNPNLTFLQCNYNQLTSLNIANGNNANFSPPNWTTIAMNAANNPNLTCIQVDAGIINSIPSDWLKDETASYSIESCESFPVLYVNDNDLSGDLYTTAVGNDANPGTAALPYATIRHAINNIAVGGIIYVDSGTFAEQVIIDKGITIIGAGKDLTFFIKPSTTLVPAPGPFAEIGLFETTQGIGDVHISNISVNSVDGSSQNIIIQTGGSVTNCTLLNGGQGIFFRIESATKTALIENNTILPYFIGVNCQGSGLTAIIRNNNISRPSGYSSGVFAGLDFGPLPQLTIQNNIIQNYFQDGMLVSSFNGDYTQNSIFGTGTYAINRFNNSGNTPSATCNWFGSPLAATVNSKISGSVTYSPWLSDGTDNNPAFGFQPVPDSCNGWPLSASVTSKTDLSCFEANDGSINISIDDIFTGKPPYTYLWTKDDEPEFSSSVEDPINLSPGTYHLSITDDLGNNVLVDYDGNIITIDVDIYEPESLTAAANVTHNICFGGSAGSIIVTAYGGTAPYSYLWSNGETEDQISNLAIGSSVHDKKNISLKNDKITNKKLG